MTQMYESIVRVDSHRIAGPQLRSHLSHQLTSRCILIFEVSSIALYSLTLQSAQMLDGYDELESYPQSSPTRNDMAETPFD